MTAIDAVHFRKEAEECRRQAGSASNDVDREWWIRLAEDWEKLAEASERGSVFSQHTRADDD